ncbi:MAG: transposase [Clostridia bacterium]|nr:transposase [Clostridia bacterium]
MNDHPHRKPTRLRDYDYSRNGCYFVTICTKDKEKLLSYIPDNVGEGLCALPQTSLTQIGHYVDEAIQYMNTHSPGVSVLKYVIMPNHVHLLIEIARAEGGHGGPPLQNIIGQFKSFTTHRSKTQLWQRSFHDHIIRSQVDFDRIWEYMDTTPLRWANDVYFSIEP